MKQGTRVEVNTFVKGLITEASPLNYPANASVDEVNFELKRDGTRARRKGMDFEPKGEFHLASPLNDDGYKTKVTNKYVWDSVGGNASVSLLVIQIGNQLNFHRIPKRGALSKTEHFVGTVTTTFNPSQLFSFTSANGKLVVAGGGTHVAVIKYVPGEPITLEYLPLKARDVWGIEAEAEVENDIAFRPTTLSSAHQYNLYNQSWGTPRKMTSHVQVGGEPLTVDASDAYHAELGVYPSNSETVWVGLQYQAVQADKDPYERIFAKMYEDRLGIDMVASKGNFILDLHERGASRKREMDKNKANHSTMAPGQDYPKDYMTTGATVVAGYAGRVFYSGFSGETLEGDGRSPVLSDYVFFSQLIKNDRDINKCYQEGNPTSRDSSDLVETDGGFIRISDVNQIVAMTSVGKYLAILANNGVWVVYGGGDMGFSATNYTVDKVTSFGCVGPSSVVAVNSGLLYWGREGIYQVANDQMGMMVATDFTAASINSYYDSIHPDSKKFVRGAYDAVEKSIRWLYHVDEPFSDTGKSVELVFDMMLGSFYQNVIHNYKDTELLDIVYTQDMGIKYLTVRMVGPNSFAYTFGQYYDPTFRDWYSVDNLGVDAKAYLLTGALTASDSGIEKQSPYLTLHFRRTETTVGDDGEPLNKSSCMMRCQWNWANTPNSKKFTSLVETYRYRLPLFGFPGDDYDNGFETVISKSKLRGRGKAITLYFETSPYKDCQLLGWNLTINGNAIT